MLPGYRQVLDRARAMDVVAHLPGLGAVPPCSIGMTRLDDGLIVYVVLCEELFKRDGSPYADAGGADFADNDLRFARLSLAAAQMAERGCDGWKPASLHLNDWQTALAAGYLAWNAIDAPALLSVHNLAHQGLFEASRMRALGIPPQAFTMQGVEFFSRVSFLKAGLNYAAQVATVSATYAEEITRPEFGCGLDGLLLERASQGRLTGIVNGVDESWDPRKDRNCPYLYDPQRWKGRYADYVRGMFGLSLSRAPLFSFVSRLVHQKGADLVLRAGELIAELGGQLVVMGLGEPKMEAAFAALGNAPPRRCRRSHRFRCGGCARPVRGQRFRSHAVAFRTLRTEPDVRPAFRRDPDRASHRRSQRNDPRRQDRVPVRPARPRGPRRSDPSRI